MHLPKLPDFKTLSIKSKILLGIGVGVPVWCILWAIFPYEFYSLFMSSIVGANVFILIICFVVAVPFKALFSRLWHLKPHFLITTIVTVLILAGSIYAFSIFYYSEFPYVVAIYLALPLIVNTVIFAAAKSDDPEVVLPLIRRKPFLVIAYGFLDTIAENFVALLLFVVAKNVFISSGV